MPTYDYRCEINGEVVEVNHRMNDVIATWGELCEKASVNIGDTPADSPVSRLATGGQVVKSGSLGEKNLPPCATGPCSGGACGFN